MPEEEEDVEAHQQGEGGGGGGPTVSISDNTNQVGYENYDYGLRESLLDYINVKILNASSKNFLKIFNMIEKKYIS